MRALRFDSFGKPAEVLTMADHPQPEPGPGEALIRVILSPIHNHDLLTVQGVYGSLPDLPATGGSEATGIVEAVGDGVDDALVGQRVAAAGLAGSWADYVTAPAAALVPVPDAMSDEAAAQLIAMPFSAIMLLEFTGVQPGDWLVQTAANGAVSKVVAALAKTRGIHTLNLVRRADAVAELADLGIENALATDQADWLDQARAIIGDRGAAAAVDSVAGEVGGALTALLGEGGQLVIFGAMSNQPLALNSGHIIFKRLTIRGFWGSKVREATSPQDMQRLFGELIGRVLDGTLELTSGGTFGLDQPAEAANAAITPGRTGKIMFRP